MSYSAPMNSGDTGSLPRGLTALILVFSQCALTAPAHAADWLPVSPEELAMRSEPKAPAAAAVYLYRQVDRDDREPDVVEYLRIKILTEEGRKFADVEIPYLKDSQSVRDIEARTIRTDGSIVNFSGTIYDKPILKTKGLKLVAKTFTLPSVEVGSIIEYRYRHRLASGYVFDSRWVLSKDLYTRHAKFSLRPSPYYALTWSWPRGLPDNTQAPKSDHGVIRLETYDIPAFVSEEHMPPEDVLKYRVDFVYSWGSDAETNPEKFWKKYSKDLYSGIDDFVDRRKPMEEALAQIVAPGDGAEEKLRKIYARTQELRNTSYDRQKSEQEIRREKQRDANTVADVWKHGYGDSTELTWLFLALARTAGFEADPLLLATRDDYFFDYRFMNAGQLNSYAVLVKLDGKEVFLDPGTAFTPFGLLPWEETSVQGLKLDNKGGSWIKTPLPDASESRIERRADFKLSMSGTLEGKVTVRYTGLEALWRRLQERNEDDTDRKEFLENDLEGDIPTGIEVKLSNEPAWKSADPALVAEYDVKVPGWAAATGRRALLPVGLFSAGEKHTFEHAVRVHPIYFSFPYQHADFVTVELPAGIKVSSSPAPRGSNLGVMDYMMVSETGGGSLHLNRKITINLTLADAKSYNAMRGFFQTVRTGDEEQVVLQSGEPPKRP